MSAVLAALPHTTAAAAGALRAEVTTNPLDVAGPACTPELAAWLVLQGLAVALVDQRDGRQYVHVPAAEKAHISEGARA